MDYFKDRRTTHGITILYHGTYISVDLAQHGLFRAKAGKGGIIEFIKRVEEKR